MISKKRTIKNPKRVRSWCFTLNNYTKEDIAQLSHEIFQYQTQKICFQEEVGEEKNVAHLQGVIQFKEKKTLNGVKIILPKAHWEVCRSLHASIKYCSKKATRNGKLYTFGDVDKWLEKVKKSLEETIKDWKAAESEENTRRSVAEVFKIQKALIQEKKEEDKEDG